MAKLFGNPQHGVQRLLDVIVGGSPGGDADAHGGLPLPDGATAPAGAVGLDAGDHAEVVSASPNATSTWLSTTSLSTA